MARTDSLTNYLTDVATAIKNKKGSQEPINASNFDTEITNLPSGGQITIPYDYPIKEGLDNTSAEWQQATCPFSFKYWGGLASSAQCYTSDFTFLEQFDFSNVCSISDMFDSCIEMVTAPNIDTSNVHTAQRTFQNCSKLKSMPNYDFSKLRFCMQICKNCSALENVPLYNTPYLSGIDNMFAYCPNLTNTSLNNIMGTMLTLNTRPSSSKRKLGSGGLGFSSTQITACHNLSNYQALINLGWSDGTGLDS